jgi:hypothetical protein
MTHCPSKVNKEELLCNGLLKNPSHRVQIKTPQPTQPADQAPKPSHPTHFWKKNEQFSDVDIQ